MCGGGIIRWCEAEAFMIEMDDIALSIFILGEMGIGMPVGTRYVLYKTSKHGKGLYVEYVYEIHD